MPNQDSPLSNVSKLAALKARVTWPVIVVALLGGHATLIISAVTMAVGGPGRGVVPDYYMQAIDFDAHKADLAASEALGWSLSITPGSLVDADGQRLVSAHLVDQNAQPLDDAAIELRLIRLVDGDAVHLSLRADADRPGRYAASTKLPATGWYQADAVVKRNEQRFVQQQEVFAAGGVTLFAEDGAS